MKCCPFFSLFCVCCGPEVSQRDEAPVSSVAHMCAAAGCASTAIRRPAWRRRSSDAQHRAMPSSARWALLARRSETTREKKNSGSSLDSWRCCSVRQHASGTGRGCYAARTWQLLSAAVRQRQCRCQRQCSRRLSRSQRCHRPALPPQQVQMRHLPRPCSRYIRCPSPWSSDPSSRARSQMR